MILKKATRFLLTISVSLTSFSVFSAWIDIGSHEGIKYTADTTYIPINIDGYQHYKEVKVKMKAFETTHSFQSGESTEVITWLDCKNQTYITKAVLIYNRDSSFKEALYVSDRPISLLEKNKQNNPIAYLCKSNVSLKQHPSLTRDSIESIDLMIQKEARKVNQTAPQMSKMEYRQVIQNMDKKMAELSSHRSRLHPSRDPENPDIIRKDTPENRLATSKKALELTCKKIKILKEQESFVKEQNFSTKNLDLVPIVNTRISEMGRVEDLIASIKAKGAKADRCY